MQFHTVATDILLVDELASLVKAEGHDWTNIVGSGDDGSTDIRLLDMVDECLFGQS